LRGLRLFVRPIEAADQKDLEAFLDRQLTHDTGGLAAGGLRWAGEAAAPADQPLPTANRQLPTGIPACGLLGKLLGDIVAVVWLETTADALRVDDILVASELRRKWIGRVMLREVEQLAVKLDRRRVVVEDARDAQEFFRRTGFDREGERWIKDVS
jgi:GNAT superfamily N-acetyltransferase